METGKKNVELDLNGNPKNYRCEVTEEDYRLIRPKIELLKRLSALENKTITVFDLNRNNYLLKSREFKKYLGYLNETDLENDDMETFHGIIHPDDLPFVLDTEKSASNFFYNLDAGEKKKYKLVYDFRVKNTSGIYIRFIHQFSVLEQDRNGRSWLALIITEIMPGKASDFKPKRRMINIENGTLCLFLKDGGNSARLLTPREVEILKLINQGYDSGRIADTLFISVNTVNNHRQNILRKTGSMDTTHAFLYAKKIGII